jgi:tetraacyldisaccharide 4'-kinase
MNHNIFIKILLFPFSFLYGLVIEIRNMFYDAGLLKASKFNLPVISVGNLSIGGAGKTPHIEFLIEILKPYIKVSTLSRGYKRKTNGFRIVNVNNTALDVGDEPLQFKRKYPEIAVGVAESRSIGIPLMVSNYPDLQCVLLDDAFQHRAVQPDLNILLTQFESPFTRDYLIPLGRLREKKAAYERADVIIISKCPEDESKIDVNQWKAEIKPFDHQKLFFTRYKYFDLYGFFKPSEKVELHKDLNIILISAIANTDYLYRYLNGKVASINELEYEDHHNFTLQDIEYIEKVFANTEKANTIIVTTEKDAMRLDLHRNVIWNKKLPIFVLPIKVEFLFDQKVEFETYIKDFLLDYES